MHRSPESPAKIRLPDAPDLDSIEVHLDGRVASLICRGRLERHHAEPLLEAFLKGLDSRPQSIYVNCLEVTSLSVECLDVLSDSASLCWDWGIHCQLLIPPSVVRSVAHS